MKDAYRALVSRSGALREHDERIVFVREVDGRRYYRDTKNPACGEFYIPDTSMPVIALPYNADKLPEQQIHEVHPKFRRKLGSYFVDKEGREVFTNNGKPFYFGLYEGVWRRIYLGPHHEGVIRSRAGGQSGRAVMTGGSYRLGGVSGSN